MNVTHGRALLAAVYKYSRSCARAGVWDSVLTSMDQLTPEPFAYAGGEGKMFCGVWSWCLICNSSGVVQGIAAAVPSHPTHFVQCQK